MKKKTIADRLNEKYDDLRDHEAALNAIAAVGKLFNELPTQKAQQIFFAGVMALYAAEMASRAGSATAKAVEAGLGFVPKGPKVRK